MHRSVATTAMNLQRKFLSHKLMAPKRVMKPCDVFINHRSIDTKRTVASLLYDHLRRFNLRPFLDNKTMKPGDKLFDKINSAILECKIGVAILSPTYCESYFCLHELALLMETNKKVIPIFCDVKPSQLCVAIAKDGKLSAEEIKRFNWALQEAKYTVGLTFNSSKGNFSDIVTSTSDIIIKSMIELQNEEQILENENLAIAVQNMLKKQVHHHASTSKLIVWNNVH